MALALRTASENVLVVRPGRSGMSGGVLAASSMLDPSASPRTCLLPGYNVWLRVNYSSIIADGVILVLTRER